MQEYSIILSIPLPIRAILTCGNLLRWDWVYPLFFEAYRWYFSWYIFYYIRSVNLSKFFMKTQVPRFSSEHRASCINCEHRDCQFVPSVEFTHQLSHPQEISLLYVSFFSDHPVLTKHAEICGIGPACRMLIELGPLLHLPQINGCLSNLGRVEWNRATIVIIILKTTVNLTNTYCKYLIAIPTNNYRALLLFLSW
jgi:hypothetical protein